MQSIPLSERRTSVVSIPSDTILPDTIIGFPVYYRVREYQYRQLLEAGARYPLHLKVQVETKGIENLYIRSSDRNKYQEYLQITTITGMKRVSVKNFKTDTTVDFSLYYHNKETLKQLLAKGKILEASHLKMLEEKKIKQLLIHKEDRKYFRAYVQQNTPPFILEPDLSLEEKSQRVYGHGMEMMEYLTSDPRSDWGYARIKIIVDQMVDLIHFNERAFKMLYDAGNMEYELSAHSLNVALFSIGFGLHLGFDRDDVLRVGYSAVFHDIGKSQIDGEIIDKAGSLKKEEFEVIKKHAKYGSFIMRSHLEKDKDILNGILYHHEHFDGSGYPGHLKGRAIPLFAQIVSLSDVYDAVSRKKPYGSPHNSFETLNIMMKDMGHQFDKKLLKEFILFMGPKEWD
jgi:HD-GYP domain-containing protein (c-di-GMP phosphodiesterase class II)